MKSMDVMKIIEPAITGVAPTPEALNSEHFLALSAANIFETLQGVRDSHPAMKVGDRNDYYDARSRLDDHELRRFGRWSSTILDSLIGPIASDQGMYFEEATSTKLKVVAIESVVRYIWHKGYYEKRSHPAKKEEFRDWLDAYHSTYGQESGDITGIDRQRDFDQIYRTFALAGGNDGDLRTADEDILLLPGLGSDRVKVLELPGVSVREATPEAHTHNKVLSLYTAPKDWVGGIVVPRDVVNL